MCVCECVRSEAQCHTHTQQAPEALSQISTFLSQQNAATISVTFSHFDRLAAPTIPPDENYSADRLNGGTMKSESEKISFFFFLIFILFGTECGSGRVSTGALVTIDWMRRMSEPALPDVRFSDSAGGPTAAESKQKETANV